jgi:hypothetical protein
MQRTMHGPGRVALATTQVVSVGDLSDLFDSWKVARGDAPLDYVTPWVEIVNHMLDFPFFKIVKNVGKRYSK